MKINATIENIDINVTDDEGKTVYAFKALDYRFEVDSVAFIKAIGEHAPAIREVAKKFEEL